MHRWKGSVSYCDQFNYREMVLRERCTLTHTLSCAKSSSRVFESQAISLSQVIKNEVPERNCERGSGRAGLYVGYRKNLQPLTYEHPPVNRFRVVCTVTVLVLIRKGSYQLYAM